MPKYKPKVGDAVEVKNVWEKPYPGIVINTSKEWPKVHYFDDKSQLLTNPKNITVIKEYIFNKMQKFESGRWTKEEHNQFLDGMRQYKTDWNKVATVVPTRSIIQCRSHAQKHFKKEDKKRKRECDNNISSEKSECIQAAELLFNFASKTKRTAALILEKMAKKE